jgi:hypothetical protein
MLNSGHADGIMAHRIGPELNINVMAKIFRAHARYRGSVWRDWVEINWETRSASCQQSSGASLT